MFELEIANNGSTYYNDSLTAENAFCMVSSDFTCWLYLHGTTIAYAEDGVVYNRNGNVMTGQSVPTYLKGRL